MCSMNQSFIKVLVLSLVSYLVNYLSFLNLSFLILKIDSIITHLVIFAVEFNDIWIALGMCFMLCEIRPQVRSF